MADVTIRALEPGDLPRALRANNGEVPAVGELDDVRLAALVDLAESALVAEVDGRPAGFVVALPPGTSYGSANYRWFAQRYDDFVYIDRVVVYPDGRGAGVGRALYGAVIEATAASLLLAEVNTEPRNDASLAFHARLGFEDVGAGEPYDDGTEVVYLAKRLADGT